MTQVLDELGLQLTDDLAGVQVPTDSVAGGGVTTREGGGKRAVAAGGAGGEGAGADGGNTLDADADLQARLDDLRRE